MFGERGYDGATLQAIAARADLTRTAVNHYFRSKKALFQEVLAETSVLMVAVGAERSRTESTLLGKLTAFTDAAVEAAAADGAAAGFMVTAMLESRRHRGLMDAGRDPLDLLRTFLADAVGEAIERGELVTDVAVGQLVELLVATLWGLAFYGGFIGDQAQLETVTAHFRSLLANRLFQLHD